MIATYYLILFYFSILLTVVYVCLWHRHFNVNFSLIYAFVPIVNVGYVFMSRASILQEYILAVKIVYIGGCFLILFITLNIYDICCIRVTRTIRLIALLISFMVYLSVFSIGRLPIFYKDITATAGDNGLIVVKTYGIMHSVFYGLVIIYLALGMGAIIYSFVNKNEVSKRTVILFFVPELITIIAFFGQKAIGINNFELVPAAYVFAQFMYLLIAHRSCMYDVADTSIDSIIETGDTGFISLDFAKNYLGSNQVAKNIFSELEDIRIDTPITGSPSLNEVFTSRLEAFDKDGRDDKFFYNKDDRIYLVDINHLYDEGVKKGYQMVITDDTQNQKYIKMLDNYNADLEREVEDKTRDIVRINNNLIKSMAVMVESRDNSTGGHIVRTSDVVEILMDEIVKDKEFTENRGITKDFVKAIIKAAPLHDIGKIAVDDAVLRKPGRFTDEEFEKMKQHAPEGAKVLRKILEGTNDAYFKVLAENVAHYHHERMDGSGYPQGLKGDEIPIEARIMAIADVYDALVSKRVYKDAMSFEEADSIMMESMGKHFDKSLEKYYVAARPRIEKYYTDIEQA